VQVANSTVQNLQEQLQQLQADLQLAEQQSAQDKQHMHELQQQLADSTAAAAEQQKQLEVVLRQQHGDAVAAAVQEAVTAAEAKAEQLLLQKEEQLCDLQQQLAQLFEELAFAQEQASESEQQVMQLQVQLEQAVGTAEQQQQESKQELKCRYDGVRQQSCAYVLCTCVQAYMVPPYDVLRGTAAVSHRSSPVSVGFGNHAVHALHRVPALYLLAAGWCSSRQKT
jgi:chromosome segregation ATPase